MATPRSRNPPGECVMATPTRSRDPPGECVMATPRSRDPPGDCVMATPTRFRDPPGDNEAERLLEAAEVQFGVWRDRWIEQRIDLNEVCYCDFDGLCEEFCNEIVVKHCINHLERFPLAGVLMLAHDDNIFNQLQRDVREGDALLHLYWRHGQIDARDWKTRTARKKPITVEFLEESRAVRQFFLVWDAKGNYETQSTHFAPINRAYDNVKRLHISFERPWHDDKELFKERLMRVPSVFPNLETLYIDRLPCSLVLDSDWQRQAIYDFVREANFSFPCDLCMSGFSDLFCQNEKEFFHGCIDMISNVYTKLKNNKSWSSFEVYGIDDGEYSIFKSTSHVQEICLHDDGCYPNYYRKNDLTVQALSFKKGTTKSALHLLQLARIELHIYTLDERENCRESILAMLLPSSRHESADETDKMDEQRSFFNLNEFIVDDDLANEPLDLYQLGHSIGSSDECNWNMRNLVTMLDKVNTILIFKQNQITQDNRDFIFGLMQANPGCWIPYLTGKNTRNNLDNCNGGRKRKRDES